MKNLMTLSQVPSADAGWQADDASRQMTLAFPLPRTHTGFALGNGLLGALVWGDERLHVTLDRSDYWDHRDGGVLLGEHLYQDIVQQFDPMNPASVQKVLAKQRSSPDGDFCNTRLPLGRFEFTLRPGYRLHAGHLQMEKGLLTLTVRDENGDEQSLTLAIHPRLAVLRMDDPAGVLHEAIPRPAWEWVGHHLATRSYFPPQMHDAADQWGWTQDGDPQQSLPRLVCQCHHQASQWVLGAVLDQDVHRARHRLLEDMAYASQLDREDWQGEVVGWWQDYWRDLPRVSLPDESFNQLLNLALYKFAAATSPHSPMPCALQGPWCEEYRLPVWSGDYHFNVNIQQIYTLAFPAGKTAHLQPLFAMLDRCMPAFRHNARAMVGIEDGILMPHAMDDQGKAAGGISAGVVLDQAVTGWTAQLYWQYYLHTGDVSFLREKALPFMTGCMKVYQAMLHWDNGEPSLPVSISAEYGVSLPHGQKQRCGQDPSNQFACMHMLLDALLQSAAILGLAPDPAWQTLQAKLPRWTLIGPEGQQRIAIWKNQDLDVSHRHHSHLACVYPFDTLPRQDDAQADAIVANTMDRWLSIGMSDWSEWSLPWAAIIQARLGYRESPALLLKLCRELFINEGLATVYLPRFRGFSTHAVGRYSTPLEQHEIMQLDGTMGIATALYEMLVHRHRGVIRFFPATPEAWRNIRFEAVNLPGMLQASGRMREGKVTRIEIHSRQQQEVCVDVPGYACLKLHRSGQPQIVRLPATLMMLPGQTLSGQPLRELDQPAASS